MTAKTWALDAACATPAGRALVDLLADHPSHWENCHVWERIRTLCNDCPVKAECRRLGEENARGPQARYCRLNQGMPYAGYPLKQYRQETAA